MKKKIIIAVVVAAVAVAGSTAYWFFAAGKSSPEDKAHAEQAAQDESKEASRESEKETGENTPEKGDEKSGEEGEDGKEKDKPKVAEIVTGETLEEVLAENPDEPTRFSSRRLEKANKLVLENLSKQKEAELKLMKDETPKVMEKKKMGHSIEGWLDRTK